MLIVVGGSNIDLHVITLLITVITSFRHSGRNLSWYWSRNDTSYQPFPRGGGKKGGEKGELGEERSPAAEVNVSMTNTNWNFCRNDEMT